MNWQNIFKEVHCKALLLHRRGMGRRFITAELLRTCQAATTLKHHHGWLFKRLVNNHTTRRMNVGRFHKYLLLISDLAGDPSVWGNTFNQGRRLQDLLMSTHLRRGGRLRLICFLLRNGVSPQVISSYLESSGCLRDKSAHQDMIKIITKWLQGDKLSMVHDVTSSDFDLFAKEYVPRTRNRYHLHARHWTQNCTRYRNK